MSNCIYAVKGKTTNGYHRIRVGEKQIQAHRHAWELLNGPIPNGMVVDHICHNEAAARGECDGGFTCSHRACVSPDHLRLVTQSENILSGLHSIDVRKECPRGHSYSEARNVLVRANGRRECAECNRIRARATYAKRKRVA